MANWLATKGVATSWELAPTFVSADVDTAWLEQLINKLPAKSHADALGWLEARLNLKLLLIQVDQSTGRIAELVKAVKSYSYMDQSPMQEIDIHEGIESTLTMLGHKLKNITLVRSFDRSVPRIMAYGGELNQVWTNLIDNAIHAVNGTGKICVGTSLEDNQLVVEIVDNGPGIPPEVQSHLFEPFYTTKPIGTGTGLGLVISNRIVANRHGGEIEFDSKPGETRFRVRLPLQRKTTSGYQPIVYVLKERHYKNISRFLKIKVDRSVKLCDGGGVGRISRKRAEYEKRRVKLKKSCSKWDSISSGTAATVPSASMTSASAPESTKAVSITFFPSKEPTWSWRLMRSIGRRKRPTMDRIFSPQVPPLERIHDLCQYMYEVQKEKAEKYGHVCGCPYASVGSEIATLDEKMRAKSERLMDAGRKYCRKQLALLDAIREGSITVKDPVAAFLHDSAVAPLWNAGRGQGAKRPESF